MNTAYNDIIAKTIGIHEHVVRVIDVHQSVDNSSVLLVSVLELLSRVEVIGQLEDIRVLRGHFFRLISFDSEKIRNLAAKSMARFHEFYEIQGTVDHLIPELFRTVSENHRHGIVMSIWYLLHKYESDVRYSGNSVTDSGLFTRTKMLFASLFHEWSSSYYVRCYLLDLLLFVGFDVFDEILVKSIFQRANLTCRDDINQWIEQLEAQHKDHQFGFDLWKRKIQNVYLNQALVEELEI